MTVLGIVMGSLSFTVGNLLAVCYAGSILIRVLKLGTHEKSMSAFCAFVLVVLPCMFSGAVVSEVTNELGRSSLLVDLLAIAVICFGGGVLWTKAWWAFLYCVEMRCLYDQEMEHNHGYPFRRTPSLQEIGFIVLDDTPFRKKIEKLCHHAKLPKIELYMTMAPYINGIARAKLLGLNELGLTSVCLLLPWNETAAIVGHELVHLKYKDRTMLDLVWKFISFVFVIGVLFVYGELLTLASYVSDELFTALMIISLPFLILYLIFMVIFLYFDNRRYWYQVKELRADRLALLIPGITRRGMIGMLNRFLEEEQIGFQRLPWHHKMYRRYFQLVEHPPVECRIRLIEKNRPWSFGEYIYHFFRMLRWFFTGKGWLGY